MIAQLEPEAQRVAEKMLRELARVWEGAVAAPGAEGAEQQVLAWSRAIGRQVLEAALQARVEREEQVRPACCGEPMLSHAREVRQALTLLGPVRVRRRYFRCRHCQGHQRPAERWLGWHGGFSFGLQEVVAWASAALPYRETLESLAKLAGVELSLEAAERLAGRWGRETLPAAPYAGRVEQDLVVQVDGTIVHLEEGWKELKLGACCAWDRQEPDPRARLGAVSYVGGWQTAEAFRTPLWGEALRRGAATARSVAVLGDGAPWIWELAQWLFPRAVQILDWYHLSEHLWTAGKVVHGEGTPPTERLVTRWKEQIWEGHSEAVEEHLRELVAQGRDNAHETLRKCADYLRTHQHRIRYPRFRALGWPVGSGVVEGACKHVVGIRFKRKSTRWSRDGGEAILHLRLDRLNGRWEERCEHLRQAA